MAVDTNNEKLAFASLDAPWEDAVPFPSGGALDQADNQQLLWDYPGVLWQEVDEAEPVTLRQHVYVPDGPRATYQ